MVIEINQGRQETLETQRKSVTRQQVPQFVLWDEANQNTRNYGIKAWPIGYLIGADGKVKWEGNPARTIRRTTPHRQLVELLESNLKQVREPLLSTSVVIPLRP